MILFFSGTGNSRYIARRLAAALGDELVSVNDRITSGALRYLSNAGSCRIRGTLKSSATGNIRRRSRLCSLHRFCSIHLAKGFSDSQIKNGENVWP